MVESTESASAGSVFRPKALKSRVTLRDDGVFPLAKKSCAFFAVMLALLALVSSSLKLVRASSHSLCASELNCVQMGVLENSMGSVAIRLRLHVWYVGRLRGASAATLCADVVVFSILMEVFARLGAWCAAVTEPASCRLGTDVAREAMSVGRLSPRTMSWPAVWLELWCVPVWPKRLRVVGECEMCC